MQLMFRDVVLSVSGAHPFRRPEPTGISANFSEIQTQKKLTEARTVPGFFTSAV